MILKLNEKINNLVEIFVYHALTQMINDKYKIIIKETDGYLNTTDNLYYFQPFYSSDIFLPSYYRFNPPNNRIKSMNF